MEDAQDRMRRQMREQRERFEANQRREQERQAEQRRRSERDEDKRRQDQFERQRRDDAARMRQEAERHNKATEANQRIASKRPISVGFDRPVPRRIQEDDDGFSARNAAYRSPRRRSPFKLIVFLLLAITAYLLWPVLKGSIADAFNSRLPKSEGESNASALKAVDEPMTPQKTVTKRKRLPYYPPCSATVTDHCQE